MTGPLPIQRFAVANTGLNPSDSHWVLSGSLLHSLLPPELAVIAEGSLSNKVFPSRKEYQNQMRLGMKNWTKKNTVHAKLKHLRPMPPPLVRTHPANHQSHHKVFHHPTSNHLWWRHFPLWGQALLVSPYLLPMPILPKHWADFPRSFDLRTTSGRTRVYCLFTRWIPSTTTWQSLSLGSWLWSPTPIRIQSSQTKERLSQWQTHHLFCGLTLPTYAQHPGSLDLPAYSGRLSQPLCHWGCLHTPLHFEVGACRRGSDIGQSRPGRLLHQHRPRQICQILVHAFGLPTSKNERLRQWSLLGLSGKIQQPRRHHQRTYFPSSQCHSENHHQRCPRPDKISTEYADFRTGPEVRPSMRRKSNGQPSFTCLMSDGRLHQWTNLVHYLQSTSLQP